MATPTDKVIREYHSDDSFKQRFNIYNRVAEYQLCLAYASDSGDGYFTIKWDTQKVTPYVIKEFKENCDSAKVPVKVFVSIGGDDPFKVGVGAPDWIANATDSLQNMIKKYHIDGIDVNYTKIDTNRGMFVSCITKLIEALRQAQDTTGFVVSLAPDVATNEAFYLPLYQAIDKTWIGTVVFQCFVDFDPETDDPVGSLVNKVSDIALKQYSSPGTQVLLGYSAINSGWDNVSLPIFLLALDSLLRNLPKVTGASVKVISDTTASFPATWIPEYLSWAGSKAAARR